MHGILVLVLCCAAATATGAKSAASPFAMCSRLESRIAAGDGIALPDAGRELVRFAGTADLADGDWPGEFLARAGRTVCVAVSPHTGCYEFFDESGDVFWTVVPVLPTTDNWVAPFRHAEGGTHPDDDLYAPWRLVDVWHLSTTEHTKNTEGGASSPSEPNLEPGTCEPGTLVTRHSSLVTRGADGPATNLCFTAFSFSETNLCFTVAWPTNEPPPESALDLYVSTNLSSRWSLLSSHPATNPPVSFSVERASVPGYVAPTSHVHGATCESITNVIASPLDGTTVYTNVLWSCSTNRAPAEAAFFCLGTRHDTDGDCIPDASEILVLGTNPCNPDTDGDGIPDGANAADWLANPLWATNAASANLVVALYEPLATNAHPVLVLGDLVIPLATRTGPFYFTLPPGELVPCRLVAGSDAPTMLWYGPPEGVGAGGSLYWGDPGGLPVATPLWCDAPDAVFGGNLGGGSCSFAVPVLSVSPDFDAAACPGGVGWCVHAPDDVVRFSRTLLPAACAQALQPTATGDVSIGADGRPSISLAGTAGSVRSGTAGFARDSAFVGSVLWGDLWLPLAVHRCTAGESNGWECTVCGCVHLQSFLFTVVRYGDAVRRGSTNRIHLAASASVDWTISPSDPNGMKFYATATGGTPSASIAGATDVWVSAANRADDFLVTATLPAHPSVVAHEQVWSLDVSLHPVTGARDALGHVINPAGSVAGWTETFRIEILPEDYLPGSGAHWVSLRGVTVVPGASPTEARVTFGTAGLDILRFDMPGYVGDPPETFCTVFPAVSRVPLHRFYILDEQGHRPQNLPDDNNALAAINKIWRQAGMEFYWAGATDVAGRQDFFNLEEDGAGVVDLFLSLDCPGCVRVVFVDRIVGNQGNTAALEIRNLSGESLGIACPRQCSFGTVAHELGHVCGLEDLYVSDNPPNGDPLPVFNEPLNANDTPNDRTGPTFYAGDTPKGATVTSLLMYGVGSSSSRADISNGRVFAVDRNGDTNLLRCGLSTLTRTPLSLQGD